MVPSASYSNPTSLDGEISNLTAPLPLSRRLISGGATAIALLLTVLAVLPLLSLLLEILRRGLPGLSWEVFVSLPAPVGMTNMANGFGNALLGTLIMVTVASLISVPIGIMTAIFLSEFGQGSGVTEGISFVVKVLSGVPSIVVGVFAYAVVVLATRQFSALAGSFALAVVMLPVVVLATVGALRLVPTQQRLASAALGGDRLQTTFRVVVATALPGITTGVLLAVARAAGETAPLIFTALFSANWPQRLTSPTPAMSVLIYNYARSPFTEQTEMAWTASLVLLAFVLTINVLARWVTRKRSNL